MSSTTDAGVTTTYTYDGDGNRLSSTNGTTTTSYAWDTNWALPELASESQAGSELRGYTYGTRVLSMLEDGASYYFHTDRLGSIAAVTSATGQTELQTSYDPFGNLRSSSKAADAPADPLGFVAQLQDAVTGLYDMRARMYDPVLGRFSATDPLRATNATPAVEAYDYAVQDPINKYDPSGMVQANLGSQGDNVYQAILTSDWSPASAGTIGHRIGSGATKKVRHIIKKAPHVAKRVAEGTAMGAAYGCGLGAAALIETGPGMIGGCIVSGAAGAGLGAEVGLEVGIEEVSEPNGHIKHKQARHPVP